MDLWSGSGWIWGGSGMDERDDDDDNRDDNNDDDASGHGVRNR